MRADLESFFPKLVRGSSLAISAVKYSCRLIEEEVEVRPEKVPDVTIDDNIDVYLMGKYCINDAWLLVKDVLQRKNDNPVFFCKSCSQDLHEDISTACDHCLSWMHIKCAGLKNQRKTKHWFCRKCHQKPLN